MAAALFFRALKLHKGRRRAEERNRQGNPHVEKLDSNQADLHGSNRSITDSPK
jgi:hypothetical protein